MRIWLVGLILALLLFTETRGDSHIYDSPDDVVAEVAESLKQNKTDALRELLQDDSLKGIAARTAMIVTINAMLLDEPIDYVEVSEKKAFSDIAVNYIISARNTDDEYGFFQLRFVRYRDGWSITDFSFINDIAYFRPEFYVYEATGEVPE